MLAPLNSALKDVNSEPTHKQAYSICDKLYLKNKIANTKHENTFNKV